MNLNEILFKIKYSSKIEDCFYFLNSHLYKKLNNNYKRYIYNGILQTYNKEILLDNIIKNDFLFLLFYYYENKILFDYSDSNCFKKTVLAFKYYQNKIDKNIFIDESDDLTVYHVLEKIPDDILSSIHTFDITNDCFFIKKSILIHYLKNEKYTLDELENVLHLLNFHTSDYYDLLFVYLDKKTCIDYLIYNGGYCAEIEFIDYLPNFFGLHIQEHFNKYSQEDILYFIQRLFNILSELYSKYEFCIEAYLINIVNILNYNNFEENLKFFSQSPDIIHKIRKFQEFQKNIDFF